MATFWVEIENAAGTKQGIGPLLPTRWRNTRRLDRAGEYEFEVPVSPRAAAQLLQKYVARCYVTAGSAVLEVGSGIIESVATRMDGDKPMFVASGPDLLAEFRRSVLIAELAAPELNAVQDAPYELVDYSGLSWTIKDEDNNTLSDGSTITQTPIYARFRDETVLNALVKVAQKTNEHFRLGYGRVLVWIGPASDFEDSGVVAVYNASGEAVESYSHLCQIVNLERVQDSAAMANRVFLRGAGEGDVRVDMSAASEWWNGTAISGDPDTETINGRDYSLFLGDNAIADVTSQLAYGTHDAVIVFKDIAPLSNTDADLEAAANQLIRAGGQYLLTHAVPANFYKLSLTGLKTVLLPGETIRVNAQKFMDGSVPVDINASLNILETTVEVTAEGIQTVAVEVADTDRYPADDVGAIVEAMGQSTLMQAHPQTNASVDTVSYDELLDSVYDLDLPFWFGNETAWVNQVLVRFRVTPLRTGIRTIETLVTLPNDSTLLGIEHVHLHGDPQTDPADPQHFHRVKVAYGIFEQVSGYSYVKTDLSFQYKNSGGTYSNVSGTVTAISGTDWWELDLTADLVDASTKRPNRADNVLRIIASSSTVAISSISEDAGTVTVNTSSAHGLSDGDVAVIAGTTNYNGVVTINYTDTDTFGYLTSNTGVADETSGTVERHKSARITAQIERRSTIQSVAYS